MKRDFEAGFQQVHPAPMLFSPTTAIQPSGITQHYGEQYLSHIDNIQRINTLEHQMKKLEDFFAINSIAINTLASTKWELKRPLSVSIEQRGTENFIACLYDVDLYGYGDTIPEALEDLKMAIINQFEYLIEQENKIQLADPLKKQLKFLKDILV